MILKRLFSTLLLAAILLQMSSTVAVVVSFKINQDYIATYLCVNRNKPELQCNGKCVLMQRMQHQIDDIKNHDRRKVQQIVEHEVLLFCQNVPAIEIISPKSDVSKRLVINDFMINQRSQQSLDALFHPPTV